MAANTPSLNKIIELVKLVSQNHLMVADFRFGPLWNENALRDLKTPYIWMDEGQSKMSMGNGSHKTGLFSFTLYCMDRIQKDETNYNEILSDTKFILETIITELDQHPLFVQLGISFDSNNDVLIQPVMEETDVNCNGHSAEITIRFPIRYTPCNVPINSLGGYTYSLNNNVYNYSITGTVGPQGNQGPQGPQGNNGLNGPQGPQGSGTDIPNINGASYSLLVGNTVSLNWGGYILYDHNEIESENWDLRYLYDQNDTQVLTWGIGNKTLRDDDGGTSLDWNIRQQLDTAGNTSLDWNNRQLYNNDNTIVLDWGVSFLLDDFNNGSIAWNDRILYDSTNNPAVYWDIRTLADSSATTTLQWDQRLMYDINFITSLDWNNRFLQDGNSNTTVDWGNMQLIDGLGNPAIYWGNGLRTLADNDANTSLQWNERLMYDINFVQAEDWNNRYLLDSNGGISIDWGSKFLYDNNVVISVDYANRQMYDENDNQVIDWRVGYKLLADDFGNISIDWNNRYLLDANNNIILDWNNSILNDSSQIGSINWNDRLLLNSSGNKTVDWNNYILYDSFGTASVQWNNRILSKNGTNVLDWSGVTASISIVDNEVLTSTYSIVNIASVLSSNSTLYGININPTVSGNPNWYSIYDTANSGFAIYQTGLLARNYFGGNVMINTVTQSSDKLTVNGSVLLGATVSIGSSGNAGTITIRRSVGGTIITTITQGTNDLTVNEVNGAMILNTLSGINISTMTNGGVPGGNQATSGVVNSLSVLPIYNQASTSTAVNTDILVNRTQTSIGNGTTQSLIDLRVNNTSLYRTSNIGDTYNSGRLSVGGVATASIFNVIGTNNVAMFGNNANNADIRIGNNITNSLQLGQGNGGYFVSSPSGTPLYLQVGQSSPFLTSNTVALGLAMNTPVLGLLHLRGVTNDATRTSFYIDSASASPLFNVRNDGAIGIGTTGPSGFFAGVDIINSSPASLTNVRIGRSYASVLVAPTTITASYYLKLGGGEAQAGSYRLIGFGFSLLNNNPPAYIGYQESIISGNTFGDLIFGTRNSTANVVANERMRITATGSVGINTSAPTNLLHIFATQSGAFRLQDGTQAANNVLISDSNGVGTWGSLTNNISTIFATISIVSNNYNVTVNTYNTTVILPGVTNSSTVTLPSASTYKGNTIKLWNQNNSVNSWSFTGSTVKDAGINTLNTLVNAQWYILESDGTNWNKQN